MHGLKDVTMKFPDKVLQKIISEYTRESGVRELDRLLAGMMRNAAKQVAMDGELSPKMEAEDVERVLGKPRFINDIYQKGHPPGMAVGLAWTAVGGEILFIETALSKGKSGGLTLTGNLGNVMKESASTALSYLRVHAAEYGIPPERFDDTAIHIHVPEGAVPKDGPSAGITMLTALASAFTGRTVKPYVAMTGEITLRGQVLPVGGVKEKALAARRAGIKDIILSRQNEKDVEEINPGHVKGLRFHFVEAMDEVLSLALERRASKR